jgi:lysozyme
MGAPARNDRGIYDDAIFLVSPSAFVAFNANTDPSIRRRGVAVLRPGVWRYRVGIHGLSRPVRERYEALVQAAPVTVRRDDVGDDTGWFGINIHRGATNTTSSIGCQTIPPAQWPEFMRLVKREMRKYGVPEIPYVLEEEKLFRTERSA